MTFDIFILILFTMGTIFSINNIIHSKSTGYLLLWIFSSILDLIITISTAIRIFI